MLFGSLVLGLLISTAIADTPTVMRSPALHPAPHASRAPQQVVPKAIAKSGARTRPIAVENAVMICRFENEGLPMTVVKFNPFTKTATVQSGFPAVTKQYSEVISSKANLPPYGEAGQSILAFGGDVPLVTFLPSNYDASTWYEMRDTFFPFFAVYGKVPGGDVEAGDEGVCYVPGILVQKILITP